MAIVLNELDTKFKYDVAAEPGGGNIKHCFACGLCTASCPVSSIDPGFNPRVIIRKVLLGMRKELLSSGSIWFCIQCYTCQAHCPQNVDFSDVMKALRSMATKEGFVQPSFAAKIKEIDVFSQKLRHEIVSEFLAQKVEGTGVEIAALAEKALRGLKG